MAIPSGLSNQLGYAAQTDYNTVATVTRFLEYESHGLAVDKRVARTRPANRLHQPANRSRHYIRGGGGPVSIPFMNQGMGLLLKHALGAVATAQVGATAEYRHTFTPAADGGFGDWLTFQAALADNTGTVRPFNFIGSKFLSWRLVQAIDANLLFNFEIDAKTVETVTALATPSYPADLVPLSFIDAAITVDGVSTCVRSLEVGAQRSLDVERICLGNAKREPVPNGEEAITGTILREFEGMDQYNAWINGTPAELVATWAYGEVEEGGEPFLLQVTLPVIEYDGEMPQANGSEMVMQNLPFKALANGTDPIIELIYATTDTTP